jgi:hypothetical protein
MTTSLKEPYIGESEVIMTLVDYLEDTNLGTWPSYGKYETETKRAVRQLIFEQFAQYADIDEDAMGFFLPHDSYEVVELFDQIPKTELCRILVVDKNGYLSGYKKCTYRGPEMGPNFLVVDKGTLLPQNQKDLHVVLMKSDVKNVTFGHADFCGNWGSVGNNTTSTFSHKVVHHAIYKMDSKKRGCFSFTHGVSYRNAPKIMKFAQDVVLAYASHNSNSGFRQDFGKNGPDPTLMTALYAAIASNFKYSIKVVGNVYYRGLRNKPMINSTIAVDKSRIFSDEELYWSYTNNNQNKDI